MLIGERLRDLRKQKNVGQNEIEKRSGLLRTYLSRVENGHTIPTIHSLEKWARALGVPMYVLFYDGEKPPKAPPKADGLWGSAGKDAKWLAKFRRALAQTRDADTQLLLHIARKMERDTRIRINGDSR